MISIPDHLRKEIIEGLPLHEAVLSFLESGSAEALAEIASGPQIDSFPRIVRRRLSPELDELTVRLLKVMAAGRFTYPIAQFINTHDNFEPVLQHLDGQVNRLSLLGSLTYQGELGETGTASRIILALSDEELSQVLTSSGCDRRRIADLLHREDRDKLDRHLDDIMRPRPVHEQYRDYFGGPNILHHSPLDQREDTNYALPYLLRLDAENYHHRVATVLDQSRSPANRLDLLQELYEYDSALYSERSVNEARALLTDPTPAIRAPSRVSWSAATFPEELKEAFATLFRTKYPEETGRWEFEEVLETYQSRLSWHDLKPLVVALLERPNVEDWERNWDPPYQTGAEWDIVVPALQCIPEGTESELVEGWLRRGLLECEEFHELELIVVLTQRHFTASLTEPLWGLALKHPEDLGEPIAGILQAAGQEVGELAKTALQHSEPEVRELARGILSNLGELEIQSTTQNPDASPEPVPPDFVTSPVSLGANIRQCMDNYGVDGGPWSNNLLVAGTVRGPSGRLGVGREVEAEPDPETLRLCQWLGQRAAEMAEPLYPGMGSEGGDTMEAFYVVRDPGWSCDGLNEESVRSLFGSALYPESRITVEPLDESARWYRRVTEEEEAPEEWDSLIEWFRETFVECCFAGFTELSGMEGGSAYPQMWLGRLPDGSVAGVLWTAIWT